MHLEINKITDADAALLNTITTWMYAWWGMQEGYSFEAVKCYMEHSLQKIRLPQTYGVFLDGEIIGLYQFTNEDLFARPDLYPWLANVYIHERYRGKGYGKMLMESIPVNAPKSLGFDEVYLYTEHVGLYEKFGWQFVSEIDTFLEGARMQRLYKLRIPRTL